MKTMHSSLGKDRIAKNKVMKGRRQLRCELLEGRQLMAIDMLSMVCTADEPVEIAALSDKAGDRTAQEPIALQVATHQYRIGSEHIDMHIHPTRIALSLTEGVNAQSLAALSSFEFVRGVDDSFAVYEAPSNAASLANELKTLGIVSESIPVFVRHDSNSEAVLVNELIVSLRPGVNAEEFFGGNSSFSSFRRLDGTPNHFVATVAEGKGERALEVLNQLQSSKLSGVEWMEPNFYQNWQKFFIPNDPRFGNQWHLHNVGQEGALVDADSDLPEAWDINQGGSSDLVIGIVDDSVSAHPDLSLWVNTGEIIGNGLDDDGNGWVDDINGWNFVSNNNFSGPTTPEDVHGTAVSGVAAAKGNNGLGVAGASYNSVVSSARMFEGFNVASDANIAAALYYMGGRTADGLGTWKSADIVNNSWGGGGFSTAINGALTWGTSEGRLGAGTPYFFASGNGFGGISYPASEAAGIPGLFAIGATNSGGTRSDYSNFGPGLNFVTPSNDTRSGFLAIDTTDRVGGDGYSPTDYTGTGSTGFGGTSSATPLAVGIAALVMDQADDLGVPLSPADLEAYLQTATDLIGGVPYELVTGKNIEFGYGRLNAATAVAGVGKAEISVLHSTGEVTSGASEVDFGTVYVGQNVDMVLRIRNQGTSPLDLSSVSIAGTEFTIASGLTDSLLGLGESALLTLRYSPTAVGLDISTVTIVSNDLDEASFTFDLVGSAQVRSVSGYVVEDWDGDGVYDVQDVPLSGRTVYLDENQNGAFDIVSETFTQSTPVAILDHVTVTSPLTVTGMPGFTDKFQVNLNITHTWNADLDAWLIAPNGQRVQLFSNIGGSNDNFIGTVFDDNAELSIAEGSAPFTGVFRPFEALSNFADVNPNGTWLLEVTDVFSGDQGSIDNWSLTFEDGESYTRTDASGYYFFDGLAPGNYQFGSVADPGWATTGDNLQEVTLVGLDDYAVNVDFGTAKNDRYYGLVFDDVNSDGVFDISEQPLAGREILVDTNANGTQDSLTLSFLNPLTFPIVDNSSTISPLVVSGVADSPVVDIDLRIDITHTYAADMVAYLQHPDGSFIQLFAYVGGMGENFTDTVFDDSAPEVISAGVAPFTGSFRPNQPLSFFNGKDLNGTWHLWVFDDYYKDFGTLNEWEMTITTSEQILTTDSLGKVAVDLSPGAYDLQLLPFAGWEYTLPSDGNRSLEVAGVPFVNQSYGTIMSTSDSSPPTMSATMMAGSSWPSQLLDYVDGGGSGAGNGYGMVLANAIPPVALNNLNRLYLQFTEDVMNVSSSTIELRNSSGVVPITVNYDPETHIATLEFSPLMAGKYRISASEQITDLAGNHVDGDGVGGAGGHFTMRFDVLPGDANGDQRVNGSDLLTFGSSFNTQVGQPNYNLSLDWNGDGRVNGVDLTVFSAHFNTRIDNHSEPGAPFGGDGGAFRMSGGYTPSARDDFFKGFGEDEEDEKQFLFLS